MTEPVGLSEREKEVLRLVARGLTNEQIALELVISTNTVKVHLRNIFAKLGVASRTEASLYAVRQGWVTLEGTPPPPAEEAVPQPPAEETSAPHPVLHRGTRWLAVVSIVILLLSLTISVTGLPFRLFSPTASPAPATTATSGWVERAAMPSPRGRMALISFQDALYAIGGEGPQGVSAATERLDIQADVWITLAPKPTAAADVQGTVVGGHIYVPGGRDAHGKLLSVVEVYLIERNQWTSVAPLPHPLSAYALTAFEGKVYLLGGWDGNHYRDEILRYTPETDDWEVMGRLPFPCGYASAVPADNHILLIGGLNAAGPLHAVLEYYPTLGTMIPRPLSEVSLGPTQSVLIGGDYLYVLAEPPGTANPIIWRRNLRGDLWQENIPPAEGTPHGAGLGGMGSFIYLVGGIEGQTYRSQVLAFQALFITEPLPVIKP